MRNWIIALMLGLLIPLGSKDAEAGYRGPFEGWIVDSETKEPVEGVVVSVHWVQAHMNEGRTDVDSAETVTDAKGHFFIPAWWSFNPWKNFTTEGLVTIFKSEYKPIVGGSWDGLLDREWGMPKGTYIWKTEADRPVILLHKASTDLKERDIYLGQVNPDEKTKLLRRELDKEYEILRLCKRAGRC